MWRARSLRITRHRRPVVIPTGGVLVVLAAAIVGALGTVGSANAAPQPSISYYEYGFDRSTKGLNRRLYNQGFRAGQSGIRKQVVILVFGAPRAVGSGFGQQLFGFRAPAITFDRILEAMRSFSNGYHNGWQTPKTGSITIAWGTSNGRIPTSWNTTTVVNAGQAFAAGVRGLRSYVVAQAYNRQHVAGAIDIEQDVKSGNWNDYPITHTFVDAYRDVSNPLYLINFGSDEIGPFETPQPGFGSWTVAGVVHLSRSPRTAACPQIYNSIRITQWTQTQDWADRHGAPIYFFCTLAQGRARPGNYGAREAWDNFHNALLNVNGRNYVVPGRSYLGPRATVIRCATTSGVTNCGL